MIKPLKTTHIWILTFADMITLLLCFMVLLLSVSIVDEKRYAEISHSLKYVFKQSPLPNKKYRVEDFLSRLEYQLQTEISKQYITLVTAPDAITIRIREQQLFSPGEATPTASISSALRHIAMALQTVSGRIVVAAHSNTTHQSEPLPQWMLSAARAASIVQFLTTAGIAESRIALQAHDHTAATNHLDILLITQQE